MFFRKPKSLFYDVYKGDKIVIVFSRCIDCKHLFDETVDEVDRKFKCPAYPNGIPKEIFFDGSGHMCDTVNAHRIHFEPLDKNF